MALWLAPLLPVYAANPVNVQNTGALNAACATSTGCSQADPAHTGSQLCVNLTPPASVAVQVSGTFVGTLTFEGTLDGQAYITPSNFTATQTATGTYTGVVNNVSYFCVRMSAYTSGSALVTINVNNSGGSTVTVANTVSTNATVTNTVNTNTTVSGTVTTNATVVGPLDGSGNVKMAVQNFPSSQNVVCTGGCGGAAWSYFSVPASALCVTAPCVIKAVSGTLAALINLSTSAQPAGACTIYDNATAASGQALFTESQIGAGQVISFTANGLHFTNGAVIQCAANPGGSGLLVLFN